MAILLIGSTGNGKSTLGNFLVNPDEDHIVGNKQTFRTARSMFPETKSVSKVKFRHGEQIFTVVDTPGLNESDWKEDFRHMVDIVENLQNVESVRVCVLCIKFDAKLDAQYKATVEYYSKLLPTLFEGNVVVVMTDFATDERSQKIRKSRGVDEEQVMEDTKNKIKEFAGLSYRPQLFTIDCLPFGEEERKESMQFREAILNYIANLPIILADNLLVAKTAHIKQMDDRESVTINGMISGYNKRLQELNENAKSILDRIEVKESRKLVLDAELFRLEPHLKRKDSSELVVVEHLNISRPWKWFQWLKEDVDLTSEWNIANVIIWTNGRCKWKAVERTEKRYRARVEGRFMRGIYTTVTLQTTKRDKFADDVATLSAEITEKQRRRDAIESSLSVLRNDHTDFTVEIAELSRYIAERREQLRKICKEYMTLEEAHKRLGNLELQLDSSDRQQGYLRGVDVIGETSITITSQAQTIKWKRYGLKLHIPQDSLPPDFEQCKLIIKVLSGHFKFPENTSLVSAVYWLDSDPGIIFSEPLTLEIQHCASNTSRLSFVWAKCSQEHLPDTFKAVEKGEFFHENVYGRVQLNHFSLWGIVSEWWEWLLGNQQLLYCAHLYYMNTEINLRHIHFVITRNLEVNITYVKHEFSDGGATSDECDQGMPVEFESNSISLELPSDEVTLGKGWKILPCFAPKITKKEVDDFNPGRRIPSCKLKAEWTKQSKPSRLTHKVNLKGAKDNSYFLIELNSTSSGLRKSSPGSHEKPSSSSHHVSIPPHHHNGCPIQEWSSEPSIICGDDRPSLCKLLKFPGKYGKINIPEQISTKYRNFGIILLNDDSGAIVSGIEREKKDNANEINQAILEKWIGGRGRQPVTWDTLVKCLQDIDLAVLADKIEEVLQ